MVYRRHTFLCRFRNCSQLSSALGLFFTSPWKWYCQLTELELLPPGTILPYTCRKFVLHSIGE